MSVLPPFRVVSALLAVVALATAAAGSGVACAAGMSCTPKVPAAVRADHSCCEPDAPSAPEAPACPCPGGCSMTGAARAVEVVLTDAPTVDAPALLVELAAAPASASRTEAALAGAPVPRARSAPLQPLLATYRI